MATHEYHEQLRLKQKQVQDALHHIGGFKDVDCKPCIPAPNPFNYRNKVDFSFTDLRYLTEDEWLNQKISSISPLILLLAFTPRLFCKSYRYRPLPSRHAAMNQILNSFVRSVLNTKMYYPFIQPEPTLENSKSSDSPQRTYQ